MEPPLKRVSVSSPPSKGTALEGVKDLPSSALCRSPAVAALGQRGPQHRLVLLITRCPRAEPSEGRDSAE